MQSDEGLAPSVMQGRKPAVTTRQEREQDMNANNNQKIVISRSAHGTADVVIYNIHSMKVVDLFALMDIWGSKGYDRFNDDGLYFEVPMFVYEHIDDMPFVKMQGIEVERQ